jgi:aldose 1-epimerase
MLEVWSDQPGLQVYTGDMLSGPRHQRRAGIALEPQLFPDSPNHPEWPSPVLAPGETYRSTIEWRFSSGS